MKLSQPAEQKLREMLNIVVETKKNTPKEPQLGTVYVVPRGQAGTFDFSKFPPMGEMRTPGINLDCLNALQNEDGLRHLNHDQIRDAVNALLEEIHNDETGAYAKPGFVTEQIRRFTEQYVRAEKSYEIAFVITGLDVDTSKQPVGDGIVSKWTTDDADGWALNAGDSAYFIDHTVMVVSARGVTDDVALERGRLAMESNLGVLRACIGYSERIGLLLTRKRPNRISQGLGDVPIPDLYIQQLYFRWNGDYVIREKDSDAAPTSQQVASHLYADVKLSGQLLNYVSESLTYLNQFFGVDSSSGYGPEFRRALDWIGSSITRPSYDDKVVDLCTALECVLCNKSDGKKGEALTIRQMVLADTIGAGPSFETPHILYGEYDMRSSIIHGSANRISNPHNVDSLMAVALSVMVAVTYLGERLGRQFTKASKLIAYLNSQTDAIKQARSYLTADYLQGTQKEYHERNLPPATKEIHETLVRYIDERMLHPHSPTLHRGTAPETT